MIGVSYAAVAALAIGGTVAYLTDTDDDVNVFTMGNVQIEQLEYERVVDENGKWVTSEYTGYGYTADLMQEFTQGKQLLPTVYGDGTTKWDERNGSQAASGQGSHQQPWSQIGAPGSNQLFDRSMSNVQDKFVFVKNTGKTDAFYRTVIAIECPEGVDSSLIHTNINGNTRFNWANIGTTTIDGVQYLIEVATYNQVLTPGEVSRPSLLQLFIDPKATSEDLEKFGDTWEVLVASQAVQADDNLTSAEMLDEAFGEITETAHPWANTVSDSAELKEALAAGGTVILDADVALDEVIEVNGDVQIVGNGNTITAPADGTRVINVQDNDEPVSILISDAKLNGADVERGISFYGNAGLTVDIVASEIESKYGVNVASENVDPVLHITDSTLTGYCAFQTWSANTVATFDNCVLNGVNDYDDDYNNFATIVVNEPATGSTLTFNNCTITATENATSEERHVSNRAAATIEFNNCTFIDNGEEVEAAIVK